MRTLQLTDLTAENARMMLQMQVVQRDYEALQGQLQAAREQNDHLLELTHRQTAEIAQLRAQSNSLADDLFDDDSDGVSVQHGVDIADVSASKDSEKFRFEQIGQLSGDFRESKPVSPKFSFGILIGGVGHSRSILECICSLSGRSSVPVSNPQMNLWVNEGG